MPLDRNNPLWLLFFVAFSFQHTDLLGSKALERCQVQNSTYWESALMTFHAWKWEFTSKIQRQFISCVGCSHSSDCRFPLWVPEILDPAHRQPNFTEELQVLGNGWKASSPSALTTCQARDSPLRIQGHFRECLWASPMNLKLRLVNSMCIYFSLPTSPELFCSPELSFWLQHLTPI